MGLPLERSLCIPNNDLTYFIESVGGLAGSKLFYNVLCCQKRQSFETLTRANFSVKNVTLSL